MKRSIYLLFTFSLLFFNLSISKNSHQMDILAGISYPSDPFAFRTFWSDGFTFQSKIIFPSTIKYQLFIGAEYNRYAFDEMSFFAAQHMSGKNSVVTGAFASIISLTGGGRYALDEYEDFHPFLFFGISVVYSAVANGTVEYTNSIKSQEGHYKIFIAIPFGTECEYPLNETVNLKISAKYNLGLKRIENSNSHFYTISIGTSIII